MSRKRKQYRVWFAQMDYVDVEATDEEKAKELATKIWRRDVAVPDITHVMLSEEDSRPERHRHS